MVCPSSRHHTTASIQPPLTPHQLAARIQLLHQVQLGLEAQNHAATIKLRAERKAGELLAELERKPGKRTDRTSSSAGQGSPYAAALADAEATRQDANRWQTVASLPVTVVTVCDGSLFPTVTVFRAVFSPAEHTP